MSRPVIAVRIGFALCTLSACQSNYVGRWSTLRGVDVDDHRRLPWRSVPAAAPVELPSRHDTAWVGRVRPVVGDQTIASSAALDSVLESNGTRAFLVIYRDTLIDARYFHGAGADSLFKSFSISKSVLSAVVGIAAQAGMLRVTDTVGAHLSLPDNPALAAVTLQQLLDNTTGFQYRRGALPWSDQSRMYYTTDARGFVRGTRVSGRPGERFLAEDISPILLGAVLEAALREHGDTSTISSYTSRHLWQAMGARGEAHWNLDHERTGIEKGESGFVARADDFARFGLLYLHGGRTSGRAVVPAEWISATVNGPGVSAPNRFREGFYHNFWWGATRPNRTRTDFYANGHFGQRIYVSPDNDLVIVRLGHSAGTVNWTDALAGIADQWRSGTGGPRTPPSR